MEPSELTRDHNHILAQVNRLVELKGGGGSAIKQHPKTRAIAAIASNYYPHHFGVSMLHNPARSSLRCNERQRNVNTRGLSLTRSRGTILILVAQTALSVGSAPRYVSAAELPAISVHSLDDQFVQLEAISNGYIIAIAILGALALVLLVGVVLLSVSNAKHYSAVFEYSSDDESESEEEEEEEDVEHTSDMSSIELSEMESDA